MLYRADNEEVFAVGLMEELADRGYEAITGALYPAPAKKEKAEAIID